MNDEQMDKETGCQAGSQSVSKKSIQYRCTTKYFVGYCWSMLWAVRKPNDTEHHVLLMLCKQKILPQCNGRSGCFVDYLTVDSCPGHTHTYKKKLKTHSYIKVVECYWTWRPHSITISKVSQSTANIMVCSPALLVEGPEFLLPSWKDGGEVIVVQIALQVIIPPETYSQD